MIKKSLIRSQLINITKSALFKASALYTVSSFVNASIPFLLLPFLTKELSNKDFGIVTMFMTILGFMMPFIGLNMEGAIARKYYDRNDNINEYIGNCILISCVTLSIIFSLTYFFGDLLYQYTYIEKKWISLAALLCFTKFITEILLTLYQVKVKPFSYGFIQICQSILNVGLSLLFILGFSMKWEGRILGQILAGASFGIVSILILIFKFKIKFKVNFSFIKHAVKFGGGLIPHALGGLLIILTNRFFILNMIGIEETGLYGAASQVANVLGFFTFSFNNAFVPWLYNNLSLDTDAIKNKIVKLTYGYFMGIIIIGLMFFFVTPYMFQIFINAKFFLAQKYLFWIIFGFVFQGMYFMVTNYITYSERTHFQAFVTLSVGLINIAANYYFIKMWGAIGAAMAFCLCFFLLFIFTWILSAYLYKMPWFSKNLNRLT